MSSRYTRFLQNFLAILFILTSVASAADVIPAYVLNEDSHPHQVLAGDVARFTVDTGKLVGFMDVKCFLEGDNGKPLTAVTLRSHGLTDVRWPFPGRTIQVDKKMNSTSLLTRKWRAKAWRILNSSMKIGRRFFGINATTTKLH